MRPTKQGEFLYFPNGWRNGGKGYVISRTIKQKLEAPALHKYDAPLLLLAVGSIFLPFVIGLKGILPMLLLWAIWYIVIQQRSQKRQIRLLENARPAPFKMLRPRYELEYASQHNQHWLFVQLVLFGLLSVFGVFLLLYGIGQRSSGYILLLAIVCLIISVPSILNRYKHFTLKKLAFQTSVSAGDPADCPIPDTDWRPVEDVQEAATKNPS